MLKSVERYYAKEVLRGRFDAIELLLDPLKPDAQLKLIQICLNLHSILQSIMFHRTLSNTRPIDVHLDSLNITYACLDDKEGSVMFFERKTKKSWFTKADEDICWEKWDITLTPTQALTEQLQIQAHALLVKSFEECLVKISDKANEEKDHIPPMLTSEPFPCQITLTLQLATFWNTITNLIPTS
ncbi:hypothetical protein BATDEDRAFT_21739 [Batrachochytrium dendrobatidis JAM81]|uniref:Autophagy-related protein 101 n=2 Tax=Batrachochytrium dendrobatidis TaxID=109871 RepID=F4NUY7_BATDJ|nr:uncharacterized protein BATDEDRAFT_21739 [Batrachochytrium dendrobatidis JAM81]EGF84054.1 hypothetical protein BATDEDRAFT_21739 [Batrachochytrium dendrobatidis JAM81]|eukprot:XP_006675366.1 hypothetical protein BATDEDRAFT_21739 [Batrachochytrium dendrobatidis JAM81]